MVSYKKSAPILNVYSQTHIYSTFKDRSKFLPRALAFCAIGSGTCVSMYGGTCVWHPCQWPESTFPKDPWENLTCLCVTAEKEVLSD